MFESNCGHNASISRIEMFPAVLLADCHYDQTPLACHCRFTVLQFSQINEPTDQRLMHYDLAFGA